MEYVYISDSCASNFPLIYSTTQLQINILFILELYELELCINKISCKKTQQNPIPQTYHSLSISNFYLPLLFLNCFSLLTLLPPHVPSGKVPLSKDLWWGGFHKGLRIYMLIFIDRVSFLKLFSPFPLIPTPPSSFFPVCRQ